MASTFAQRLQRDLLNHAVGGWTLEEFLGAGNSAAVFRGVKEGQVAAVKVFDPDLVEGAGESAQLSRIERELSLRGTTHPNLITIFDGGKCASTDYLFVVMELSPYLALSKQLLTIERSCIRGIISRVAAAARFLESKNIAHRDIKPDNIVCSEDGLIVKLLDLGVIRPIGIPGRTDESGSRFVGTLRYSSPEFLFRRESDNHDGWRAVTFYQLGATLYDLIMRRPIFEEYTHPYAQLVDAVKNVIPHIEANDVDADLVRLARSCLVKDPKTRLLTVTWDDFDPSKAALARPSVVAAMRRTQGRGVRDNARIDTTTPRREVLGDTLFVIETAMRNEFIGYSHFPRGAISKGQQSSHGWILLEWEKSERHHLSEVCRIRFEVHILSEPEAIISISLNAWVGDDVHADSVAFYCGPLDDDDIQTQVTAALHLGLDLAQGDAKAGDNKVLSRDIISLLEEK